MVCAPYEKRAADTHTKGDAKKVLYVLCCICMRTYRRERNMRVRERSQRACKLGRGQGLFRENCSAVDSCRQDELSNISNPIYIYTPVTSRSRKTYLLYQVFNRVPPTYDVSAFYAWGMPGTHCGTIFLLLVGVYWCTRSTICCSVSCRPRFAPSSVADTGKQYRYARNTCGRGRPVVSGRCFS